MDEGEITDTIFGKKDHQKAMDAKRGVLKRGKYTSLLDRWQNDEVYRESQLVHGWTEEWVKYFDCISKIDISHDAPYRQPLRCESTVYMRSVDSNIQAGPLCQRPDFLIISKYSCQPSTSSRQRSTSDSDAFANKT